MLEVLEKAVMMSIGVAAITRQKVEDLVVDVKENFKLSEDEGRQLTDRIINSAKENRERIVEVAEAEVQKVVARLGLVSRDDFDQLSKRIQELESRCKD